MQVFDNITGGRRASMQWWFNHLVTQQFPNAIIGRWNVDENGVYSTAIFTLPAPVHYEKLYQWVRGLVEVEHIHMFPDHTELVLTHNGMQRSWEQCLTLSIAKINTYDLSMPLVQATRIYMQYRSPKQSSMEHINMREEISNPLYLLWYAYSYALRYENLPIRDDLCIDDYHDSEKKNLVDNNVLAKYVGAWLGIFPEIISTPLTYQCWYCEKLAQLILRYLSQRFMQVNKLDKYIAHVAKHVLAQVLARIDLLPLAGI